MRIPFSLKLRRAGNNFFKLVTAIGVSEMTGVIGAFFTTPAIRSGWYAGLIKPALNPPALVFGPVWTALYFFMGVSLWLVWKSDSAKKSKAVLLFAAQLVLNALWSVIFFGLKSPGWAFVDIVFLWVAIVWTTSVFYNISKPAAYLLVPYILWVSFALYLNYAVWMIN